MSFPTRVPDELHETVRSRLAGLAQRYTTNRKTLVATLWSEARPLTLPEILAADAALAQSSAYRNLVVLEEAQVVHRLVTTGQFACWELAEDLTGHHHHHLICRSCGVVEDFTASADLERLLGDAVGKAAGFIVEDHRLDLLGTCSNCAAS